MPSGTRDGGAAGGEVAVERLGDDLGLLVHLLGHEVLVGALLGVDVLERHVDDVAVDGLARGVEDRDAGAGEDGVVALVEVGDAVGEGGQREGVGADVGLAVAVADRERRAAAGGDEEVLLALEEEAEREGAVEPRQRGAGGGDRGRAGGAGAVAEVDDDLGVGLGLEDRAFGLELGAQGAVVLDDAVVDDGDAAGLVGVGVALGRLAVGRPAGVADAGVAADRVADEEVGEGDELADRAPALEPPLVEGGDAGAVVAAVLEALQRLEDQRRDLVAAEDGDDAAHQAPAFSGAFGAARAALSARNRSLNLVASPGLASWRARAKARAPAGDVLGDDRARRDDGAVADRHRRDEGGVRADEGALADLGAVLEEAVVVAGDGAGADVAPRPDAGVADVG